MSDKLNKDFWKLFENEGTVIEIDVPEFDKLVDNMFVKNLRTKLDLTQKVFGNVFGVTKKTIEKWEQGVNPVKGTAARLLYLINDDYNLANKLYSVNIVKNLEELENASYSIKQIAPLVAEKSGQIYKLEKFDDQFEERFDSNQYVVEGGILCLKKSNHQFSTS